MDDRQFRSNNPFLEDMREEENSIAGDDSVSSTGSYRSAHSTVVAPREFPPRHSHVTLPQFWADRPRSWFATAEARFRLHGVNDEQSRFDLLTNALNKESIGKVIDLVENPHPFQPYTAIKERLLASLQLTDYQKIDALLEMPPLGGRKPSELLADMLELCPRGNESNIFFTHFFLKRLPAELRIMLGEDDHQDPRQLAVKADQLWAIHGGKAHTVAAVEPAQVAAVNGGGHPNSRGRKQSSKARQGAAADATGARQAAAKPDNAPSDLAQLQSGLCYYHWTFGERATKCRAPCNWGN